MFIHLTKYSKCANEYCMQFTGLATINTIFSRVFFISLLTLNPCERYVHELYSVQCTGCKPVTYRTESWRRPTRQTSKQKLGGTFLKGNITDIYKFMADLPVRKIPGVGKINEMILAGL